MAISEVRLDDDLLAGLAASVGPAAPEASGLTAVLALAAAPLYRALVGPLAPSELEDLRHVGLSLDVARAPVAGEVVRVEVGERARGRLGRGRGVVLAFRATGADAALVAEGEVVAQTGPAPESGDGVGPSLAAPRAVRVGDGPVVEIADRVPHDAVAAWLALSGDEVPIHREGHRVAVELGEVAVPGALVVARLAARCADAVGPPTGMTVRFRHLIPAATDVTSRLVPDAAASPFEVRVGGASRASRASGTLRTAAAAAPA